MKKLFLLGGILVAIALFVLGGCSGIATDDPSAVSLFDPNCKVIKRTRFFRYDIVVDTATYLVVYDRYKSDLRGEEVYRQDTTTHTAAAKESNRYRSALGDVYALYFKECGDFQYTENIRNVDVFYINQSFCLFRSRMPPADAARSIAKEYRLRSPDPD